MGKRIVVGLAVSILGIIGTAFTGLADPQPRGNNPPGVMEAGPPGVDPNNDPAINSIEEAGRRVVYAMQPRINANVPVGKGSSGEMFMAADVVKPPPPQQPKPFTPPPIKIDDRDLDLITQIIVDALFPPGDPVEPEGPDIPLLPPVAPPAPDGVPPATPSSPPPPSTEGPPPPVPGLAPVPPPLVLYPPGYDYPDLDDLGYPVV